MPNKSSSLFIDSEFTQIATRANTVGLELVVAYKAHAAIVHQTPILVPIRNSEGVIVYQEPKVTPEMQAQFDKYAKLIADLTQEAGKCNDVLMAEVYKAKEGGYTPEWVYKSRVGWVRSNSK